jgi:hypothetical protein
MFLSLAGLSNRIDNYATNGKKFDNGKGAVTLNGIIP